MKLRQSIPTLVFILIAAPLLAAEAPACPTTAADGGYRGPVDAWPGTEWYGSKALSVMLPEDGMWPTTKAGHLIAVKLFWWSEGFQPGMEDALHVEVADLESSTRDATIVEATNAHSESLGGWTMLTGIDFPYPGCWRISGSYRGEELSFVVKVIDVEEFTARELRR